MPRRAKILVELSISFSCRTRYRHDAFACDLDGVRERGADILKLQLGIGGENLAIAFAIGQEILDQRDPDALALDARFAKTNQRIDCNSVKRRKASLSAALTFWARASSLQG